MGKEESTWSVIFSMTFMMVINHQQSVYWGPQSGKFDPIDNRINFMGKRKMQPLFYPGFLLKEEVIKDIR